MRTQIPGQQILDQGVETNDIKDRAVTDAKLSETGVSGGTYTKVTVNPEGRVTNGENPTTLAGYGITDAVSINDAGAVSFITVNDESATIPQARYLSGAINEITIQDGGASGPVSIKIANDAVLPGNAAVTIPSGSTAQRGAGQNSQIRFNTDLAAYEAPIAGSWNSLVLSNDKRLTRDHILRVSKDPSPYDFSSISSAVAAVLNDGKRWLIQVEPGTYTEPTILVPSNVHIQGLSDCVTVVKPQGSGDLFILSDGAVVENLEIQDVTGNTQYAFVAHNLGGDGATLNTISFANVKNALDVKASTTATYVFLHDFNYEATTAGSAIRVTSENNVLAYIDCSDLLIGSEEDAALNPNYGIWATGSAAAINLHSFTFLGKSGTGDAIYLQDGASVGAKAGVFFGWSKGVHIANVGAAGLANLVGVTLNNNVNDVCVFHPNAVGTLFGAATRTKVQCESAPNFTLAFVDITNNGFVQTGDFYIGSDQSTITNMTPLLTDGQTMGLMTGGQLSAGSGTVVNVSAGTGYIDNGNTTYITWNSGSLTLTPGTAPYIYINGSGVISQSTGEPDRVANIVLGRALVGASSIITVGSLRLNVNHFGNDVDAYLRKIIGPIFESGSIVTENATPFKLDVTAGSWFYSTQNIKPSAGTAITFLDVARNSSGQLVLTPTTTVNNTELDSPTGPVALSNNKFTKHTLYCASEGGAQLFLLQRGQAEYATLDEAKNAPLPTPLITPDATPNIAAIIVQHGASNISFIQDIRPRFGSAAASSSAVTRHGDLTGLSADDHTQYLLGSGARAMTGNLDLGANNIVNVGTVDGIDVSSHASRHLPNGADPLASASASTLTSSTTNTEGIANSFARSDHTHAITGFQTADNDLTAISALTGTGISVRTAVDAWTLRSIVGTSNQIVLTNGDGVAGNPTIALSSIGTAGTYAVVTTDAYGRVTSGAPTQAWNTITSTPITLSGYGITDAQPLNSDLTALANTATTGLYTVTGVGTSATRTLTAPAAGLTITNGNGIAGNPTFTLANDLAAVESLSTTGIPVRTATDTWTTRSLTAPASGLAISNSDGVAGNPTFALTNDLGALEALITTGFAVRTAADTWVTRAISGTSGHITITNGDGVAGNPTIDLVATGTAGTYTSVTTDAYGRVISGVTTQSWSTITGTPTTLAGYGIADAQPLDSDLTALANTASTGLYAITGSGTSATRSLTAPAAGFTITNPAGVAGNPTFALSNDLAALEGLSGTGFAVRTAADTWVQRSIGVGSGLTISNADGVSGNPTIDLATVGTAGTYTTVTTDTYGRVVAGTSPSFSVTQQKATTIPVQTGTAITAGDNTTPLITEGFEVASISITPTSTTASVTGMATVWVDAANNNRNITIAVFRGSICVSANSTNIATSGRPQTLSVSFVDVPGSTTPQTYSVRIGQNQSGTTYVNRALGFTLGNSGKSAFIITEYL